MLKGWNVSRRAEVWWGNGCWMYACLYLLLQCSSGIQHRRSNTFNSNSGGGSNNHHNSIAYLTQVGTHQCIISFRLVKSKDIQIFNYGCPCKAQMAERFVIYILVWLASLRGAWKQYIMMALLAQDRMHEGI